MNLTITRITLRGLIGQRRFLLLLPLPLLMVGLAAVSSAAGATPPEWVPPVAVGLGFGVVLPVTALIIGSSVLGSEIDNGTIMHILAKPLPRREIVLSKLVIAIGLTALTVGVPMLLLGLMAESFQLGLGLVAGVGVGSLAYSGLFLLISLVIRRPVLVGLVYLLVWEGMLTNMLPGARVLSIQQYAMAVAERTAGTGLFHGNVSVLVALVLTGVVTVVTVGLAIDRLRSFTLTGETS